VEPGDAHAEAGAADLRREVIRDRMLLYRSPGSDFLMCCIYNIVSVGYLQHIHRREDLELLRSAAVLPNTTTISGHVYEVTTGLVNQESE